MRISCFLFELIIIKQNPTLADNLYVILIRQFQKRCFADSKFLGGTLTYLTITQATFSISLYHKRIALADIQRSANDRPPCCIRLLAFNDR